MKIKWYHSCGSCYDSRSCAQVKKSVTNKYLKIKLYFEPESPSVTRNVCYHYNSRVTGAYMACMFVRNSGGNTSQIGWFFESNLRPFGYFKCATALWFTLGPSFKGNQFWYFLCNCFIFLHNIIRISVPLLFRTYFHARSFSKCNFRTHYDLCSRTILTELLKFRNSSRITVTSPSNLLWKLCIWVFWILCFVAIFL